MHDQMWLKEARKVNRLPVNQSALNLLSKAKEPVYEDQVHAVQLLQWALDNKKVNRDPEDLYRLQGVVNMLHTNRPKDVAAFLALAEYGEWKGNMESLALELWDALESKAQENDLI